MDNFLNEFFVKLMQNFGVIGAISILIISYAVYYGIRSIIKDFAPALKNKIFGGISKDLKKHPMFKDLQFLRDHKLNELNVQCPIRKNLYINIIKQRIKCNLKIFGQLVKEDLNALSNRQFYIRVQSAFDDVNTMHLSNCLSEGVPQFVLDAMAEKILMAKHFYKNQIKSYCYNQYLYTNNNEKMWAILDLISVLLQCYMNILQQNLAQFNGDIKKLSFKGFSCVNCASCVHDEYLNTLKNEIQEEQKKVDEND